MAGEASLKVAAQQVRRAMDELKREISQLEQSVADSRRQTDQAIADANQQIRDTQSKMADPNISDGVRTSLLGQEQDLRKNIDAHNANFVEFRDQTEKTINFKRSELQGLEQQARTLEQNANRGL